MPCTLKASAFQFGRALDTSGATSADFFSWLAARGRAGVPFWPRFIDDGDRDGDVHKLWTWAQDSLLCGVLVSSCSSNLQHFEDVSNGRTILRQRESMDSKPIRINLFCIRTDTCKGIYTHHRGAHPFSTFLMDLWWCYVSFVKSVRCQADAGNRNDYRTSGRNKTTPLFSTEEFRALVESVHEVREISASTVDADLPDDAPRAPGMTTVHRTFHFAGVGGGALSGFALWLRSCSFRNRSKPRGRVTGLYEDGTNASIDFFQTMRNFLPGLTSDNIGSIDTADISGNEVMAALCDQVTSNRLFSLTPRY